MRQLSLSQNCTHGVNNYQKAANQNQQVLAWIPLSRQPLCLCLHIPYVPAKYVYRPECYLLCVNALHYRCHLATGEWKATQCTNGILAPNQRWNFTVTLLNGHNHNGETYNFNFWLKKASWTTSQQSSPHNEGFCAVDQQQTLAPSSHRLCTLRLSIHLPQLSPTLAHRLLPALLERTLKASPPHSQHSSHPPLHKLSPYCLCNLKPQQPYRGFTIACLDKETNSQLTTISSFNLPD